MSSPRSSGRCWGQRAAASGAPFGRAGWRRPATGRRCPVAKTVHGVVVHEPHRLHEGIADRRAHEGEASIPEGPAEGVRLRGPGRHLPEVHQVFWRGRPPTKPHKKRSKEPLSFWRPQEGPGVPHGTLHLEPVPDDPRIGQEPLNSRGPEPGHPGGIEAGEGPPVALALAEDGQPRQPGLGPLQHEELEEHAVVVDRDAPLAVVVVEVERVRADPPAAGRRRRRHARHPPARPSLHTAAHCITVAATATIQAGAGGLLNELATRMNMSLETTGNRRSWVANPVSLLN